MGQQHNKTIKRRRLKAYKARKKALVRAGVGRSKISLKSAPKAAKKVAAKKPAAKKAAKPAAAAAPEAVVE